MYIYTRIYKYMLYTYTYIYTRIFARALDSPIHHDLGRNPLDIAFEWCWEASCSHAYAFLDEAHVQKRSYIDRSIFTC